ncbi:hypothetical protein ES708_32477 [subsurface metagenome]
MSMIKIIAGWILEVTDYTVIAVSLAVAFLLIVRSLLTKHIVLSENIMRILDKMTLVFVKPVRLVIPSYLYSGRNDYSPLISAITLMFLGMGIHALIRIISENWLRI